MLKLKNSSSDTTKLKMPLKKELTKLLNEDLKKQSKKPEKSMSDFEKLCYERAEKIASLERKISEPREWELMGEVDAEGRPEGSLLERELEFDLKSFPDRKITPDEEEEISEMIKNVLNLYKG